MAAAGERGTFTVKCTVGDTTLRGIKGGVLHTDYFDEPDEETRHEGKTEIYEDVELKSQLTINLQDETQAGAHARARVFPKGTTFTLKKSTMLPDYTLEFTTDPGYPAGSVAPKGGARRNRNNRRSTRRNRQSRNRRRSSRRN